MNGRIGCKDFQDNFFNLNIPHNLKDIQCTKAFIIRGESLDFLAVTCSYNGGGPCGLAWVKFPNGIVQVFRTENRSDDAIEEQLEKMSKVIAEFYGYELECLDLTDHQDDDFIKSCLFSEITRAAVRLN